MKTTQKLIGLIVFLLIGISAVAAQDLIILRDGNVIEARVTEISPTEIRYRRFDFLDGPIFVVPVANVLSIRFEDGTTQTFNQPAPVHTALAQQSTQTERQIAWANRKTAIDPDRFIFGISFNGGGFLGDIFGVGGGGGLRIELGRGNFNTDILLGGNSNGFVGLITFNYFSHGRNGGFYSGIGLGTNPAWYGLWDNNLSRYRFEWRQVFTIGLNIGYKFVLGSGLYFRTGSFLGAGLGNGSNHIIWNPDISFGWTMR
ncbi:MAG: hypothetical protein FWC97_10255 [Treponema sp.]|nr:hypothetical protein [Treponema sp.]